MKLTKRYLTVILVTLTLANNVYGDSSSAENVVKETTGEVLERINSDRDRLRLYPEHINEIVSELIVPHFDFATMSRLVLDNHWQAISESEQQCFTAGFRNLLVNRYADTFLSYSDQQITYEPAKSIGNKGYVSVRQIISHAGIGPFYVDYPMRPENSSWKVVDIIIDNVSLLKSYRATFNIQIKKNGLQNFIMGFQECSTVK